MSELKESGKLATIIGLDKEVIEEACVAVSKSYGPVSIALENARQQFVVGGKDEDVDAVVQVIREKKPLKIVEIKVSDAFHTYLMAPMVESFKEFVYSLEFREPKTKILLNFKGGLGENAEEIREDVIGQCENVVKWVECMDLLLAERDINLAEVGVNHIISGLMKGIDRSRKVYCMSNFRDFEEYISLGK